MSLSITKPKIVFFGTQDFGAAILQALIDSKQYDIVAVVTRPDRPIGRKQEIEPSPVKVLVKKHDLKVMQPESLKSATALGSSPTPTPPKRGFTTTYHLPPTDLFIVCQYGLIIPKKILDLPKYGALNVHASLLPKYRGASPIQTALVNGEKETGVTIMLMDEKMDHGSILAQEKISIDIDDTTISLSKKMSVAAAELLSRTIPAWLAGKIKPKPQNDSEATFCKILTRDDGKIDFNKTADEIYNLYRGLTPWPGVWTLWEGKRLKLLKIKKANKQIPAGYVTVETNKIFIGTSRGSVEALELQLEGRKAMTAEAFIRGYKNINGINLG